MSVPRHDEKLPVSFAEVWTFQRDHAKGTTPLAQYYLDCARTYCPPSKAHKRRILLKRDRPIYTRPPKPCPSDTTNRSYHNSAAALGRENQALAQRAVLVERALIRGERVVLTPEPPCKPLPIRASVPKSDDWPTLEQIEARIAMLAADAAAERARLDAMKG